MIKKLFAAVIILVVIRVVLFAYFGGVWQNKEKIHVAELEMEKLRPRISDEESFNKLIKAVEIATRQNESIAQLQKRIVDLGSGVINVAKEVLTFGI